MSGPNLRAPLRRHPHARNVARGGVSGLRSRLAILAVLALGLAAGSAVAGGASELLPRQVAHPEVRQVLSSERPAGLWRAIVAVEYGVPYLVIEQFERGRLASRDGLPTLQRRIDGFRYGRGSLSFGGHALALNQLRWAARELHFVVDAGSEELRCQVPIRGNDAFVARCGADDAREAHRRRRQGSRVGPPRLGTNWAADATTIRACGDATYGAANQAACLSAVAHYHYAPARIIGACDDAMFGDQNTLECLATAAATWADPTQRLEACDVAMFGDAHALRCFALAVQAPYEPSKAIAECDRAMYGDKNALACIEAATRANVDVSRQIKVCDEAMYGDDAALSCLVRGISL